jgi:hypothetical protein
MLQSPEALGDSYLDTINTQFKVRRSQDEEG